MHFRKRGPGIGGVGTWVSFRCAPFSRLGTSGCVVCSFSCFASLKTSGWGEEGASEVVLRDWDFGHMIESCSILDTGELGPVEAKATIFKIQFGIPGLLTHILFFFGLHLHLWYPLPLNPVLPALRFFHPSCIS